MSRLRKAFICGKWCEAPEGDFFVQCSFDKNHVLLRSRMPYHIIKCVKQHPNHTKKQCPYDSTEYIEEDEFADHILYKCESKVDSFSDFNHIRMLKERGELCKLHDTPFFHDLPEPDEDWGGPAELKDPDDMIYEIPEQGVGRGVRRKQNIPPKNGKGRAASFERIWNEYKRRQASLSASTSVSESDTIPGQFEDVAV